MRNKGSVYKKMIITYTLVLCIPILCSVAFYRYTYSTVQEQSLYHNRNLLETIRSSCDREFNYYKSILYQLRIDELVRVLVRDNNLSDAEKQWNAHLVQENIQSLFYSMQDDGYYCKDIFIYQRDKEEVLGYGSKLSFDSYSDLVMNLDTETAAYVKQLLESTEQKSIYRIDTENGTYMLLLEMLADSGGKRGKAVVGAWIRTDLFDERIRSMEWNKGTEWGLRNETGEYLYMTDTIQNYESELYTKELKDGQQIILGQEEYLVYKLSSEAHNGEYVLLSSMKLIGETADRIRNIYFLCLAAILVLGILATRMSMRLTYNPLRSLLNTISQKSGEKSEGDEYQYLEKQVNSLLEKYDSTRERIKKNRKAIHDYALEKLLLANGEQAESTPYVEELYGKFEDGRNAVLLFEVRDGEPDEDVIIESVSLKRYIVANVLAEGIGEVFGQDHFEYGDKVVMIVNLAEEKDGEEELRRLCNYYCEYVEEHFKFRVCTFVGNPHEKIAGIHDSYLEACLVENFCEDKTETYVCYKEIGASLNRKYQYTFDMEEMVSNALRNGNLNLVNSLIDNVLEKSGAGHHGHLKQYMLYDIFTTLLKVAEEIGISTTRMPLMSQSLEHKNLLEIKQWFHGITEMICMEAENVSGENKGHELSEEIMAYIHTHFTDPDLNISQISFEFKMTPTYLSAVFKKQTGKNILDVIKQLRIEYAKELIKKELSVAEVAEQAGFRESSTFIRVFKSSTGLTPGQMKRLK